MVHYDYVTQSGELSDEPNVDHYDDYEKHDEVLQDGDGTGNVEEQCEVVVAFHLDVEVGLDDVTEKDHEILVQLHVEDDEDGGGDDDKDHSWYDDHVQSQDGSWPVSSLPFLLLGPSWVPCLPNLYIIVIKIL